MISVVIPTRKSSSDLEACLRSVRKQSRKPGEIIVVFDSREDRNIKLAKKYSARAVFDANNTIGGAYFTGSSAAKGGIIAFTDDDCIVPEGWLESIENEFDEDIDVVGGEDFIPDHSSDFQKAVFQIDKARIMKRAIYGEKAKSRLRAANIAYRKRVFEHENFNPLLKGLQEPEFHHRLFKKGFRMKFNPGIIVYHKRRNSLNSVFSQIYRNGKAKTELLKLYPDMLSAIDVIPFIFVSSFLLLMAYALFSKSFLFPWLFLLLTMLYFLIKPIPVIIRTGAMKYYPMLVAIIFARETGYALGILAGVKKLFR